MIWLLILAGFLATSAKAQPLPHHLDSLYSPLLDTAYIIGEMNVYLGRISADTTDQESIMNIYGDHGSDLSPFSIFGSGLYAGLAGIFSPFNPDCEVPPKIYKESMFVAYLTENERLAPRISTYSLIGYLYDRTAFRSK